MPWCPICKAEYIEGIITCSDCNEPLVNELPLSEANKYELPTFLITANNNFEADFLESLLNSYKIPVLKKYRNAGDYLKVYMGSTNFGIDIFVPSKLLGKAKDALNTENLPKDFLLIDEETKLLEIKYKRKQRIISWLIILFFIPGVLWYLFALILQLIFTLSKT